MLISIEQNGLSIPFTVWRPADGTVFTKSFSFDTETTRIDEERKWLTPAYVLGAACDGKRGFFVSRENLPSFIDFHRKLPWVMHNAPFDLKVIHQLAASRDIYDMVERNRIWDTMLLHRLLVLGTDGHPATWQCSLDHCAMEYLGIKMEKDAKDKAGDVIRLSWSKYLRKPIEEIDPLALQYLAMDAAATIGVYRCLRAKIHELLVTSQDAFGFVDEKWIADAQRRWGPLTHHIQLRAAIVLETITANGLPIDVAAGVKLRTALQEVYDRLKLALKLEGYMPGQKGCKKALQEILRRIESRNPDVDFPRTATGRFETQQETLAPLAGTEPFIRDYLEFHTVEKLLGTFVKKLGRSVLHPSFNPLLKTGRTSSFGEINAQNLPRDDKVRQCIIAPPRKVFVVADYAAIEMATLGQAIQSQLGFQSTLVEAINLGHDVHRRIAAAMTGKKPEEVTKQQRQRAKAINFGKPGGMGNASLIRYAKASYGVVMSEQEAEVFSNAWLDEWPEMKGFLARTADLGEEIATLLNLTPQRHFDATIDNRFWWHAEQEGCSHLPSPPLGWMFVKAMKEPEPRTRAGDAYREGDLDFFWDAAKANIDLLPINMHAAVLSRRPSPKLSQAFMRLVGRRSVFTLTGRLRAKASFCAQRNTMFQGLAADGAKSAMWHIWRAGYAIHNFIHDEFLVAVPEGPLVGFHAQVIKQLMIKGMQEVVPDVRIGVEYVVTKRWSKNAKLLRDAVGKVQAWDLPAEGVIGETISKKVTNLAKPKTKIVVKVRPKCLATGAGNPKAT